MNQHVLGKMTEEGSGGEELDWRDTPWARVRKTGPKCQSPTCRTPTLSPEGHCDCSPELLQE